MYNFNDDTRAAEHLDRVKLLHMNYSQICEYCKRESEFGCEECEFHGKDGTCFFEQYQIDFWYECYLREFHDLADGDDGDDDDNFCRYDGTAYAMYANPDIYRPLPEHDWRCECV